MSPSTEGIRGIIAEPLASATLKCLRLLLLTPPMTQLNTPYPATAYLTGFLRQHEARLGLSVSQADPALELFLRIFSGAGLRRVLGALPRRKLQPSVASFVQRGAEYADTVD